jgi:hypothetical protein
MGSPEVPPKATYGRAEPMLLAKGLVLTPPERFAPRWVLTVTCETAPPILAAMARSDTSAGTSPATGYRSCCSQSSRSLRKPIATASGNVSSTSNQTNGNVIRFLGGTAPFGWQVNEDGMLVEVPEQQTTIQQVWLYIARAYRCAQSQPRLVALSPT